MATRTGLRTLHELTKKICQIIVVFAPVLGEILSPSQKVYLDALSQACTDFVLNVPAEIVLGDEVP